MAKNQYLIVGANFINKGAEAMLKTIQQQILRQFKDAKIYMICQPAEKDIAIKSGINPVYDTRSSSLIKLNSLALKISNKIRTFAGKKSLPFTDYAPIKDIRKDLKNLKKVIDVSGFAYGDKRGYLQPLEAMKIMDFCDETGAEYIFMPQAWGGFKEQEVAQNCRKMITRANAYFTRDEVSRKYVSELLSQPLDKIPIQPDIAFHFPVPTLDGKLILSNYGYTKSPSLNTIGISPNMRIYERMPGKGADNRYVQTLLHVIKSLQQDYQIILIPNEILPEGIPGKDDRLLCGLLYNNLENKGNCTLVNKYHSAEEIKAIIRECDLIIASRFHSLIFALSLGIPSIAVSWSHKYVELFRLFKLERYVIEDKDMDGQYILESMKELYKNRETISASIRESLVTIKAANFHVFDQLS